MAASTTAVSPLDPDLREEAALHEGGFRRVAGVDEAGRGAWAGPLVAAAVILPEPDQADVAPLAGVRDSKLLTVERRESLYETIWANARSVGVGWVSADEIDLLGLTAANALAMTRAVRGLSLQPDALLVDCFTLPTVDLPQRGIVRGDRTCLSIAAASIVAKVYRDRWLTRLADEYHGYGFEQHKGYGVAAHRAAISSLGLTPIHRLSYAPIRALRQL